MDDLVAAFLGFEPQEPEDAGAAPPANAEESFKSFEQLFSAAGGSVS